MEMQYGVKLDAVMPAVCRLGLATRGNSRLRPSDVEFAVARGLNYLNWCGRPDALSQTIAALGPDERSKNVVAVQFESRSAADAARELDRILTELRTTYLDIATLYYVESEEEWREIISPGGAMEYLAAQKRAGRLRCIGLTSHQRRLAAGWVETGSLDLLMIRYNAAHRGAEREIFPATSPRKLPVVAFTGLRWGALLRSTTEDPPGYQPPKAVDCYRFCLANEHVSVVLAAPADRRELEEDLELLDDWRPPGVELEAIRGHGDRVKRHAGVFW
jgi:predicted aldo/keto reductase-like oxidoreductase